MSERFALSALLSQALVAFVIELDNEFEQRIPHRSARLGLRSGPPDAPWLASMAMWANCMRFLDDDGVTAAELELRARLTTNYDGMRRWGYVTLDGHGLGDRLARVLRTTVVRPTTAGGQARDVWSALPAEIETRWETRFGPETLRPLRAALEDLVGQLSPDLPDFPPILGYGLTARWKPPVGAATDEVGELPLFALLSRPLVAFADEFDAASAVSLAMTVDVLRPIDEAGVAVRDLPELSGVAREPIAMSLGWLEKRKLVAVETLGRTKSARLTAAGARAKAQALARIGDLESAWRIRYGEQTIANIRGALEPLVGDGTSGGSGLYAGLAPPPNGWRAFLPMPAMLPQFPMVTHRGGYPDGS